jgi:hypothetical protein
LANTEVIEENKKYNEKQIFIVSFNGEYNLLMEADSADDADDWVIEIRDHIRYANTEASQDSSADAEKARNARAASMRVDKNTARYPPAAFIRKRQLHNVRPLLYRASTASDDDESSPTPTPSMSSPSVPAAASASASSAAPAKTVRMSASAPGKNPYNATIMQRVIFT